MELLLQKFKNFFQKNFKLFFRFFITKDSARVKSDKNLIYSLASSKIPRREQFKHLFKFLDPREKLVLKIAIVVFLVSAVYLVINFYQKHLILSPAVGDTYIEGVVGYPQTINPLYASNRDVDADLSRLIYSSLFSYDENGRLMPDLAVDWQIEDEGKTYIVFLRDEVKWHNGEYLKVDDVIFTFNLIKAVEFRSPLRSNFSGVEIEKLDDHSLKFSLSESYADFLALLTFGVMPQNAWATVLPEAAALSELNLKPIGTGPYMWESLIKNKGGEIKEFHLVVNPDYYGVKPYISEVIFKFFPDYVELVQALNANDVDAASYVPDDLKDDLLAKHSLSLHNLLLPQINSIFFNTEKNKVLDNIKVRQALNYALDRDKLFNEILGGAVSRADGPILASDFSDSNITQYNLDKDKAQQLLTETGFQSIEITQEVIDEEEPSPEIAAALAYANANQVEAKGSWLVLNIDKEYQVLALKLSVPENGRVDVGESIKKDWEAIGVRVYLNFVPVSNIKTEMIADHNFEAFLYGQVVGFDPDLASFWHSSQIGGQGLNLASYNNAEVDILLTEGRQITNNIDLRLEKYKKFQEIISAELPVIFLYSPNYAYVQAKRVRGFEGTAINEPSDRFAGMSHWYLKTKKRLAW